MRLNDTLLQAINLINKEIIEEKQTSYYLLVPLFSNLPPIKILKANLELNFNDNAYYQIHLLIDRYSAEKINDYLISQINDNKSSVGDYDLHIVNADTDVIIRTINLKRCFISAFVLINEEYEITLSCDKTTDLIFNIYF